MPSVFLKLMSELIFNVIVEKVENLHLTDLKFKHPNEANAVMSKHPTMTIAGCRETKHPHLKKKIQNYQYHTGKKSLKIPPWGLKLKNGAIRNCWISARGAIKLHPIGEIAK